MTLPGQDAYWFEPKRRGYGAGRPIAWQAWAVSFSYGLVVTGSAWFILPLSVVAFLAIVIAATSTFLLICARKTRGGWHWRWQDSPACRRARSAEGAAAAMTWRKIAKGGSRKPFETLSTRPRHMGTAATGRRLRHKNGADEFEGRR